MNRYQFEDLISEYIENQLSIKKRKEFEAYLEVNPDCKEQIESVKENMAQMRAIPKVSAASDFNEKLLEKIRIGSGELSPSGPFQYTILGFKPMHASLMTGLVIAFLFISAQLFSPYQAVPIQSKLYTEDKISPLSNPSLENINITKPTLDLAEVEEDSTLNKNKKKSQKDFSKKIQFVND
tara:strand:- start:2762 stop:3304 length:543 start_codon:yes stop_codon:yes gene_type:complete